MERARFVTGILFAAIALSSADAHERRGAAIVYANGAASTTLNASADRETPPMHYGYGRAPREGALIDLRGRAAPEADASGLSVVRAAVGHVGNDALRDRSRPDWLEQERVGAPYQAEGRWWTPAAEPGYAETGQASFYAAKFAGKPTANGEIYDPDALTAAHPTLPIPSLVQVTNLENGREVILRVNDRGPFAGDRILDVSRKAADVLGFVQAGKARVHVRYLGPAPKRIEATNAPSTAGMAQSALTTAPPTPAPLQDGFVVQVGAFASRGNAEAVRRALAAAGNAEIEEAFVAGKPLHRVRVGAWRSRVEAETVRDIVAEMGYPGAVVTVSRSPKG